MKDKTTNLMKMRKQCLIEQNEEKSTLEFSLTKYREHEREDETSTTENVLLKGFEGTFVIT